MRAHLGIERWLVSGVEWITETVGRLFPEAWERFERDSGRRDGERVVEAYARRLAAAGDVEDRARAAASWDEWEATHISLDPNWTPGPLHPDPVRRATFATLVTHYWANDAFLRDGQEVFSRLDAIADIPAVLIHGRRDVSGPVVTPWRLHEGWPASRLVIVEGEGHGGPESMDEMRRALDAFARM